MLVGPDGTSISAGCRDCTGVSGLLAGRVCDMEAVAIFIVGAGVSGRTPRMIVGGFSARSEGRGGVCTSTGVWNDRSNFTCRTVSTACFRGK